MIGQADLQQLERAVEEKVREIRNLENSEARRELDQSNADGNSAPLRQANQNLDDPLLEQDAHEQDSVASESCRETPQGVTFTEGHA